MRTPDHPWVNENLIAFPRRSPRSRRTEREIDQLADFIDRHDTGSRNLPAEANVTVRVLGRDSATAT